MAVETPHGGAPPHINARLYRAASIGNVNLFKQTLEEVSDENELTSIKSPQNNSILHVASSFGHDMILQFIVEKCPSLVNKRNKNGDTALHMGARDGHLFVVKFFIDYAKNVPRDVEKGNNEVQGEGGLLWLTNVDGNTALHEAIKYVHHIVANALIKADKKLIDLVNHNGESCFYLAVQGRLQGLVAEMFRLPIDHLLRENPNGNTALHAAIHRWHYGIIKILLEKKPELVKLRDHHGSSPFQYVVDSGFAPAVCDFLRCDTSIAYHQDHDGAFPIHKAGRKGYLKVFQEIIHHCPDSRELRNVKGQNALHVAVESGHEELVKYIMRTPELEKLINEMDFEGNTPLHIATRRGHGLIVSDLLQDKSVNLSVMNKQGFAPSDIAIQSYYATEFSVEKSLISDALWLARAPLSTNGFKDFSDLRKRYKREIMEPIMKSKMNTLLIVATIIVTVTFAAGFTMPGGYNSDGPDKGMATMLNKVAFQVFVISNTIAMYSSILALLTIV